MSHQLLQQVRLLDPLSQSDQVVDVLSEGGKIAAIAPQISEYPPQTEVRDCRGLVLGPGLVDLYSHSGEPGFEARETLVSLAEAAIAGGFTRLAILPDTQPVLDRPDGLARLYNRCPQHLPLQMAAWGAITQNLEGAQLVELAELAEVGIVGFSDGTPIQSLALVRRALEYLGPLSKPIALWPCHLSLAGDGVVREGIDALQSGLPEYPTMAETSALAALLEILAVVPTPVHIMRVSTARSVQLLEAAKAQGLPVTASTTWMHLLCNSESVHSYDPNLRLDPPLGNPADQAALIAGLESGVLDAIAIDHQAYTYEEKTKAFRSAPPGAIGLELALSLLWQTFVATQRWSALDLWRRLSTTPSQCLHQKPPALTVGQSVEMTLFDPQQTWQVDDSTLKSLGRNTPWLGKTVTGRVIETWCPKSEGVMKSKGSKGSW